MRWDDKIGRGGELRANIIGWAMSSSPDPILKTTNWVGICQAS